MIRKWNTIFLMFVVVGVEYSVAGPQPGHVRGKNINELESKPEDKAAIIEAIFTNAIDCLNSLFNPDTLQEDIEDAKAKGRLDQFLKDSCDKSPQMRVCLDTMSSEVTPYLDDTLREQLTNLRKSNDQIMDYFCDNGGASIASISSFVSNNGRECLLKTSSVQDCAKKYNETFYGLDDVVSLALKNQCDLFDKISSCVVEALKKCPTDSSSEFAESLFKNIKNRNYCSVQ